MDNINFEGSSLSCVTYVRSNKAPSLPPLAEPFLTRAGKNVSIGVLSSDEIPLFFAVKGMLLGGAKISQECAVKGTFKASLHATFTQYNIQGNQVEVYMGPCLTFSHTLVERKLIEQLMDQGYRIAAKRTDGVDFLDVPILVLAQLRELGIPPENIHIGDFDTFENPDLLFSKLRGDKEENLSIAQLR